MKSETNPEPRDSKSVFFAGQRAAIIGLAAFVFLVLLLHYCRQTPPPTDAASLPIIIEVRGEVRAPGVYLFHMPSVTVAQAIEAAGGMWAAGINALPAKTAESRLHTGQQVQVTDHIQTVPEVRVLPMSAKARLALGHKLDINRATQQDLLLVPGMRPEFAAAIVQHRQKQDWTALRQLQTIPGIGPKTIRKWADYLEVDPKAATR